MEILKGMVRDPGYPDVECTYLKTDDGKLYYFIKDGKLSNGNIIANSVLKEAIGHAPYTSLGLITSTGEVLIPFENKTIKTIGDSLLLVEKNTPTTESVVNALKDRSDPFAATNLINVASTIKEQLKSVMGLNGDFIFDNQFSEAALYTFDGVNVGGSYFSFIGENAGSYYMSGNELGKSIIKYDPSAIYESESSNPQSFDGQEENNTLKEEATSGDNLNDTGDDTNQNYADVNSESNNVDSSLENNEVPATPNINIPLADQFGDSNTDNVNQENAVEDETNEKSTDVEYSSDDDTTSNDATEEVQEETKEANDEANNEKEIEESTEEEVDSDTTSENNDTEEQEVEESEASVEENDDDDTKLNIGNDLSSVEDDTSDNQDESGVNNDLASDETNSEEVNAQEDDEKMDDEEVDEESTFNYPDTEFTNPVIIDATNTIRKLLEENRRQRQIIDRQEGEIETLNSSNDILKEDNDSKSKEIISIRKSMTRYRNQNTNLTRENSRLKSTVTRQNEIIDNLKNQNSTLKEQVAGISALGNAVKEASTVINNHQEDAEKEIDEYDSDLEYGYLDSALDDSFQKTKVA